MPSRVDSPAEIRLQITTLSHREMSLRTLLSEALGKVASYELQLEKTAEELLALRKQLDEMEVPVA